MKKSKVLDEIIIGYRGVVNNRYQYQKLKQQYDLPKTITEVDIENIKNYFLTYIYPDLERRKGLNEAFESLDHFIKNPRILLNLLKDSLTLLFTHGRYLPKILYAGLKAIKSFRAATKFENSLVSSALENKIKPSYTEDKIQELIQQLPFDEIEEFIASTESLFLIVHDTVLVNKVKEIMVFLISRMKKKTNLFSKTDIQAVTIGMEMIEEGEALLNSLTDEDRAIVIQYITKIERDYLENLFEK